MAQSFADKAKEEFEEAKTEASEGYQKAKEWVSEAKDEVVETIQEIKESETYKRPLRLQIRFGTKQRILPRILAKK